MGVFNESPEQQLQKPKRRSRSVIRSGSDLEEYRVNSSSEGQLSSTSVNDFFDTSAYGPPGLYPYSSQHPKSNSLKVKNGLHAVEFSELSLREQLAQLYQYFDEIEFTKPSREQEKWLRQYGVTFPRIKLRREELSSQQREKFNLKKIALSYVHALLIALEITKARKEDLNVSMQQAFALMNNLFKQIDAVDNLDKRQTFKAFYDIQFNAFQIKLADLLFNTDVELSHKDARTYLEEAELIANLERHRETAAAIVTVRNKNGKNHNAGQQILVDSLRFDSFNGESVKYFLTEAQKKELARISSDNPPFWFKELHPLRQQYLENNLEDILAGKYPAFPATKADMPGARNWYEHRCIETDAKGVVQANYQVHMESTIAPFDISDKKERERLALLDAKQVIAKLDVDATFNEFWGAEHSSQLRAAEVNPVCQHIQLLSPLGRIDGIVNVGYGIVGRNYNENNQRMHDENVAAFKKAVGKNSRYHQHSCWAINFEGQLRNNSFTSNENSQNKRRIERRLRRIMLVLAKARIFEGGLLEDLKKAFNKQPIELAELDAFISHLQNNKSTWAMKLFQEGDGYNSDKANRFILALKAFTSYQKLFAKKDQVVDTNKHLFAAALEILIMQGLGFSVKIKCKSTKDRARMLLVQVAAMLSASFNNDGVLPAFNATDLNDYYSEFQKIYDSGHQQTMAEQNSYGRHGLVKGEGAVAKLFNFFGKSIPGKFLRWNLKPTVGEGNYDKLGSESLNTFETIAQTNKKHIQDPDEKTSSWKRFTTGVWNFVTGQRKTKRELHDKQRRAVTALDKVTVGDGITDKLQGNIKGIYKPDAVSLHVPSQVLDKSNWVDVPEIVLVVKDEKTHDDGSAVGALLTTEADAGFRKPSIVDTLVEVGNHKPLTVS